MAEIDTAKAFKALLQQEKAVLLVYAERSKPSCAVGEYLRRCGKEFGDVEVHRVRPWALKEAHFWLYDQPELEFRNSNGQLTCLAALGTLVWICKGSVVDIERHVLKVEPEMLKKRTLRAFATTGHPRRKKKRTNPTRFKDRKDRNIWPPEQE